MPAPSPLAAYLVLQRALDRDVLTSLRGAAAGVDAELKRLTGRAGIGDLTRAAQLTASQAEINRQMATHWSRVGNLTAAAQADAAADAAEAVFRSSSALSDVFDPSDRDYLTRSVRASAAQNVSTAMERVSGSSYIPLAESVYDNKALASGQINSLINSALTRGASAEELARDIRGYVNPDTPGGARYASMRLARTELNNAFHASQIRQAQENPWTTALKWNLSGSHPVPDECNQYAENQHFSGGGVGEFKPNEVPGKPHPNCLCYTTSVDVEEDDFIAQFQAGSFDTYLEEEFDLSPLEMVKVSPSKAIREYAWGQGDSGGLVYADINGGLRAGQPLTGRAQAVAEGLDKAFTLAKPTTRSMQVYRQYPGEDDALVQDLLAHARAGTPWTDKGFASTTTNEDILEDFAGFGGGGVQLNIQVPAGSKVIHVDDYLDEMDYRQNEWLLPRGTKFNLGKPRPDGEGGWIIDVTTGDLPVKPIRPAISTASKIEQLEQRIRSEQARARKNPMLKSATAENIRKARVEINKLRKTARR